MDKMLQIKCGISADTAQAVQGQERDKDAKLAENHEGQGGIYELTSWKPSRVRGKLQISGKETVEVLKVYLKRKEDVAGVRFSHGGQGEVKLKNLIFCTDPEKIKAFREACKDPFNVNERVTLTDEGIDHVFQYLLEEFFIPDTELRELIINAMNKGKGFKVVRVLGEGISIEVPIALPTASHKRRPDIKISRVPIAFSAISFLVAERIRK